MSKINRDANGKITKEISEQDVIDKVISLKNQNNDYQNNIRFFTDMIAENNLKLADFQPIYDQINLPKP